MTHSVNPAPEGSPGPESPTAMTTMPTLTAALLVDGALSHLWYLTQDEAPAGCCPHCCSNCKGLKDLLDRGQLDTLYGVFVDRRGGDGHYWDAELRQVDRAWLLGAWSVDLGCREDHDAEEVSSD